MTYRYSLQPDAKQDIEDIWFYLALHNTSDLADRQHDRIYDGIHRLCDHPFIGRLRDDLDEDEQSLRSLPVAPYVIFYRLTGATVEIIRILHGRRDVEAELN